MDIDSASQAAENLMKTNHWVGVFMAIGLFDAVKVSLMALRVYLLVLVALLVYQFVMLVR